MTLFEHDDVPLPGPRKHRFTRRGAIVIALNTAISIAILLASYWALTASAGITDAVKAWSFRPSAEISRIMDRSTMTPDARFLFLASSPVVGSLRQVQKSCTGDEPGVEALGCYLGVDRTIHIARVTSAEGSMETTAAHELLHAAWDRMSQSDRARLSPLLEAAYERASARDPGLVALMSLYARSEPGERANELHSIIGSEVVDIGPELEAHYAKYFGDRAALLALDPAPIR